MGSLKNPENEAEIPARMPISQQGQGERPADNDTAGQQGGTEGGEKPKTPDPGPQGSLHRPKKAETARQERAQGGQPHLSDSGDPNINRAGSDHPEDEEGAAKATADNDLKTGQ